MIRENIYNLLSKVYDSMTPEELDEVGVFVMTTATNENPESKHYGHSGFNCQNVEDCKDLNSDNRIDRVAMEILKHSLSELNRSRDKHMSYDWSAEDMAKYAYEMAIAMDKEKEFRNPEGHVDV